MRRRGFCGVGKVIGSVVLDSRTRSSSPLAGPTVLGPDVDETLHHWIVSLGAVAEAAHEQNEEER